MWYTYADALQICGKFWDTQYVSTLKMFNEDVVVSDFHKWIAHESWFGKPYIRYRPGQGAGYPVTDQVRGPYIRYRLSQGAGFLVSDQIRGPDIRYRLSQGAGYPVSDQVR